MSLSFRSAPLLHSFVLAALAASASGQQFDELVRYGLPAGGAWAVALADVDGDGSLDIVLGSEPQDRLYINDGYGEFADVTAQRMPLGGDSRDLAVCDIDGDGDVDLLLLQDTVLRAYLNDGTGTFTDGTAGAVPAVGGSAIAAADLDGDGDLDLVVTRRVAQNLLLLNDGSGVFTDVTSTRMPVDADFTSAIAIGDVDGDHDLDLALGNGGMFNGTSQSRLYINNGAGFFQDATASHMPSATAHAHAVALGDVDGDGDLDMLIGTCCGAGGTPNWLYENDGTGRFADITAGHLPGDAQDTRDLAFVDVDGDGDLDLVVANFARQTGTGHSGDPNQLYINDGAGVFASDWVRLAPAPYPYDWTTDVAVGDVDGDGDSDILFGNLQPGNKLLMNLRRQLHAPAPPQVGQTYTFEAYARYGPPALVDLALPYLSTGSAAITIPSLGVLGIDPAQAVALPPVIIAQPTGMASVSIAIPNLPWIVGTPLFGQALMIPWPSSATLSNVTRDAVTR